MGQLIVVSYHCQVQVHTESDGVNVLVEDESQRDGEIENGKALGTDGERQDLNGVGHDKRGESDAETEVNKSVDHRKEMTYS